MELESQLERLQERLARTSQALAQAQRELEFERRRGQERRGMLVRLSDVASIFQSAGSNAPSGISGAVSRSPMESSSFGSQAGGSLGGTQRSRSLGGAARLEKEIRNR
jgi:hypothetical protein